MDARQQVLQEIAALEEQVSNFRAEMDRITGTEPLDQAAYEAIKAELNHALEKLDAKRAELANLDAAGEAAKAELSESLENIDIGGEKLPLRVLVVNDEAYQLVILALQEKFAEQAQTNAQVVAALKSSYESQIEEYEADRESLQQVREDNYRLSDKCADLELKRDAAADQLYEAQEEINRLKTDNDNLRKQLEASAKPKETTEDAREALERWKNSRPAITNLRWKDDRVRTVYIANLASNGEEIEFGYLEKGKYREVTAEEAESFRATAEEAPATEPVQTNIDTDMALVGGVTPPEIQFQTEEVSGPLPTEQVHGRVVYTPEEVTAKLDELERRMDMAFGVGRAS